MAAFYLRRVRHLEAACAANRWPTRSDMPLPARGLLTIAKAVKLREDPRCIDTALESSPYDIEPWLSAPSVDQAIYEVQPRSVVLVALALPGK